MAMTSQNQSSQQTTVIAAGHRRGDAQSSLFDKALLTMPCGGVIGAATSTLNETPRRVQELFGLLRDIENDPRFRPRFANNSNMAQTITDVLRQRLLATRNESAGLVFGFGKLRGDDDNKCTGGGGDDCSSKLQQTLDEIENELQKLKRDMTAAVDTSTDGAKDRNDRDAQTVAAVGGNTKTGPKRGSETADKSIVHAAVTSTSADSIPRSGGEEENSNEESSNNSESESSGSTYVFQQKTTMQNSDRVVDDTMKLDTPPADEDSAVTLLENERKRVGHLLYLNKALETKVQTIETQKLDLKKQLDARPEVAVTGDVDGSTTAVVPVGGSNNSVLEEKLQRTVASLDLFKVEAANMHHEIRQLRKREASFAQEKTVLVQEAAHTRNDLSRLQILYDALEKQTKTLAREKTQTQQDLDEERSRRIQLKARLDLVVGSKADISMQFESQLSSLNREVKILSGEVESREKALAALRQELAQKATLAATTVSDLRRSNVELTNALDQRDQEIREMKKEHASQALLHAADLDNVLTKLRSGEKSILSLQEDMSRDKRGADTTIANLRRANVEQTRECERKDEEIRALREAVNVRDTNIQELKAVITKQAISVQSAKADHETLENQLADVETQQEKKLKACEARLEAQTVMCTEMTQRYDNLQKDLAFNQITSDQIDHVIQEKLRIEQEKFNQKIADLEEEYKQERDRQRSDFEDKEASASSVFAEKEASMRRLLLDAQSLASQFEAKLEKSRAENARCLSLIVKMGKHQLENVGH